MPPTRTAPLRSRWTVAIAVGLLFVLLTSLESRYRALPGWSRLSTLALIAGLALVSTLAGTSGRLRRVASFATVSLVVVLTAVLVVAVATLTIRVFERGAQVSGIPVLSTTLALWASNVVVFALWYWMVDRGGPDRRAAGDPAPLDLLFPQNASANLFPPTWMPRFTDYLFVSFVTSAAFSPADTLPVTPRAKLLMMAQAVLSLATVAVLVARAINILD